MSLFFVSVPAEY